MGHSDDRLFSSPSLFHFFFFNDPAPTEIYTLSLQRRSSDLPELRQAHGHAEERPDDDHKADRERRSEEHTSELQSHVNLVCRLLLEKKKKKSENSLSQ